MSLKDVVQKKGYRQDKISLAITMLPFVILVLSMIYISSQNPYFFTVRNISSILLQTSSLAVMSIGMTFVLIGGGIDLSIPPVMAMSAILGVMYMSKGGNSITAFFIMIGAGILCGIVNGFAIAYLNMIPFVVTLSMQMITDGFCMWITNAVGVTGMKESFKNTVLFNIQGFALPIFLMILLMIIAQVVLKKSYLGRWLYLSGTNVKMAEVSGIPAKKVVFGTYLISGFMAGLAGMILSARMNSASATFGEDVIVMDIVGAAVVGGASTNGGMGTAFGAVFGAVFITIISNFTNMLHIQYNMILVIKGILIIVFVALDMVKQGRRETK